MSTTNEQATTPESNEPGKQTLGFQTEVKKLLQLMIHSLYSNPEIFLRELISNASDACDKLRFETIDKPALLESDPELRIRVECDKAARTITISDNGVGMSRQEAIDHLGTIARSGTQEFFGSLSGDKAKDSQLIGQFGVGIYSAFIVADKVTVLSRRAGLGADDGVRWESDGSGEFTVDAFDKAGRGTDVILHIRPKRDGDDEYDLDELLSGWKLKQVIRKYSDHISLPIQMHKEEWDKDKGEQKVLDEFEAINQANALWARSKSEITEEQYTSFYKNLSNDFTDPLAHTHNRVEGRTEYTQLLYIPAKAPYDIYDRQNRKGIKLYVRRVFIMDDAEQLLPAYLRFVRGVIDSNDLPLNVSREILQESRDVKAIREGSSKRVLSMLEDLVENHKDKYGTFWKEFGQVLKEGLGEDFNNQERLAKLLRFASTSTAVGEQTVSLAEYTARMKQGQDKIYYVTGDSDAAARNSPHLEVFHTKGVEVLLMTDRVDEWMLSFLNEFDGKSLVSVARGGLDLGTLETEEEKKQNEQDNTDFAELLKSIKDSLSEQVKEVRLTHRLTDSPACLVSDDGQISGHLERLLKQSGQKAPPRQPILEINPKHPLVLGMKKPQANVQDWSQLLFDQAQLAEGGQLADPAAFVRRMNQMLLAQSPA